MNPKQKQALNVAILLNSYRSPFIGEIRDSYTRSIHAVAPHVSLTYFYPAEHEDDFPDPAAFDLIIIGGGNADPRKRHPWMLRVHQFILDVVAHHPRTKLCGICWGHQTISLLFGGEIVDMETPELGVTEAKLTPAGRRFLSRHHPNSSGTLSLQQHHRRAVGTAPPGFTPLLAGNQAFLSPNGTVLTFQGHPEKDARCAKLRVYDAVRWFGVDENDRAALAHYEKEMERPHDGAEVWGRVLEWAREKYPSTMIHL